MDKLVIKGEIPLSGEVTPSGNKNAALPLLAACLLTDEPVILHNVPNIQDVNTMKRILESLGVTVEILGAKSWKIHAKNVSTKKLNSGLLKKIRASILLAGPLTARLGEISLSTPGGDAIGRRKSVV